MDILHLSDRADIAITFSRYELYQLAAILRKPPETDVGFFATDALANFFLTAGVLADVCDEAPIFIKNPSQGALRHANEQLKKDAAETAKGFYPPEAENEGDNE